MASIDDIVKAFGAFSDGVNSAAVYSGIHQAKDQVELINAQQIGELEKRQAQEALSNDLALRLGALGTPVSQIQSAQQAIAPQPIKTAVDAFNLGAQKGDQEMIKFATIMQEFEQQPNADQRKFTSSENEKKSQLQRDLAGTRANQQAAQTEKLKPVSTTEFKMLNDAAKARDRLVRLLGQTIDIEKSTKLGKPVMLNDSALKFVSLSNNLPGVKQAKTLTDPKFAEYQRELLEAFQEYKLKVTGAASTDKESEEIKKQTPNMSATADVFLGSLLGGIQTGLTIEEGAVTRLGQSKRDVSAFRQSLDQHSGINRIPVGSKAIGLRQAEKELVQMQGEMSARNPQPVGPRASLLGGGSGSPGAPQRQRVKVIGERYIPGRGTVTIVLDPVSGKEKIWNGK